jgi:hypothetical protein
MDLRRYPRFQDDRPGNALGIIQTESPLLKALSSESRHLPSRRSKCRIFEWGGMRRLRKSYEVGSAGICLISAPAFAAGWRKSEAYEPALGKLRLLLALLRKTSCPWEGERTECLSNHF